MLVICASCWCILALPQTASATSLKPLFPGPAYVAYLDAGTGSIIIQVVVGGLAGGLFAIKIFWGRIRRFFGGLFSKSDKDGNHEE